MWTRRYTSSQADKYEGSKLFKIDEASVGGGNVTTTMNLLNTTNDEGQRKEQGTNQTIYIKKLYKFEKEHAQAPIRPNSTGSRQLKRISNTPLGNIQKGRISRRYYRSLFIDQNKKTKAQQQKTKSHDCTQSSFFDKNKIMIARKVNSLTKTKQNINDCTKSTFIDQTPRQS